MCQGVHDFAGFTAEPIKEVMKETVDMAKGVGRKASTYGSWRNSRAKGHHIRGVNRRQLDGRASEPAPGAEEEEVEAVPENNLMFANWAGGFRLFRTAFNFFYNMDPSMTRALKLKQMVEEGVVLYGSIFREVKKQRSQTEMMMHSHKVLPLSRPTGPASPARSAATPEMVRPAPPPLLSPRK